MILNITPEAYKKLMTYVRLCDTEVGGLASLDRQTMTIDDVTILNQTATGASVEQDEEATLAFSKERRAIGDHHKWRVHWHSHVNMEAFHSTTDTTLIENFGVYTDWLISLVFNKKGEMVGRLDTFERTENGIPSGFRMTELVRLQVLPTAEDTELDETIQAELDEKVQVQKYVAPVGGYTGGYTGFDKKKQDYKVSVKPHKTYSENCMNCLLKDDLPHLFDLATDYDDDTEPEIIAQATSDYDEREWDTNDKNGQKSWRLL